MVDRHGRDVCVAIAKRVPLMVAGGQTWGRMIHLRRIVAAAERASARVRVREGGSGRVVRG
jgi:hypothetical protein